MATPMGGGGSCFINAAVQALIASARIRQRLQHLIDHMDTDIAQALRAIADADGDANAVHLDERFAMVVEAMRATARNHFITHLHPQIISRSQRAVGHRRRE